jgi:hypothetical protein
LWLDKSLPLSARQVAAHFMAQPGHHDVMDRVRVFGWQPTAEELIDALSSVGQPSPS